MPYDADAISKMTGEQGANKAPEFKLNELKIHGTKGNFVLRQILEEKTAEGKYPKLELGKEMKVVFLKHRRILSSYKKVNGVAEIKNTNEHNRKTDTVVLYGGEKGEKGIAEDIRAKYQDLRTQQIIYSYVPELKQIVRLVVKGSSLFGPEDKQEQVKNKEMMFYYDYLSSFRKDKDKAEEHCWQYMTIIRPIEAKNQMDGTYYSIEFVRGDKLSEEQIEKVATMIQQTNDRIVEIDAYFATKTAQQISETTTPPEATIVHDEDDAVKYPDEQINVEDIPF